ncbi:hypothetical protein ACFLS0_00580 [Candidatus Bipolaricaulota bacterium]
MKAEESELVISWSLELEERLENLLETVPYRPDTVNLFFPPLVSILLDSCSILDAVFRDQYDGKAKRDDLNFKDYAHEFEPKLGLQSCRTILLKHPPEFLEPFSGWIDPNGSFQSLDWWQDHNDVKHDRIMHSNKATLRNCVLSLCALHQTVSQLECFFRAAKRHNLLHFGGWNEKHMEEFLYSDPEGVTVLFESSLFATPIGSRSFPDDIETVDPYMFGKGKKLWRYF